MRLWWARDVHAGRQRLLDVRCACLLRQPPIMHGSVWVCELHLQCGCSVQRGGEHVREPVDGSNLLPRRRWVLLRVCIFGVHQRRLQRRHLLHEHMHQLDVSAMLVDKQHPDSRVRSRSQRMHGVGIHRLLVRARVRALRHGGVRRPKLGGVADAQLAGRRHGRSTEPGELHR